MNTIVSDFKDSLKVILLASACLITTSTTAYGENKLSTKGGANSCYAKALPTKGHGGQAWASDISTAQSNALDNCRKYASQTGGTPNTCKVVESHCK